MTVSSQQNRILEDQLRQVVLDNSPIDEAELNDRTELLAVVDSLGVAELLQFVEDRIGRELREEEMTRDTFDTIASLAGRIRMENVD